MHVRLCEADKDVSTDTKRFDDVQGVFQENQESFESNGYEQNTLSEV